VIERNHVIRDKQQGRGRKVDPEAFLCRKRREKRRRLEIKEID
jgi:hypothetical protein